MVVTRKHKKKGEQSHKEAADEVEDLPDDELPKQEQQFSLRAEKLYLAICLFAAIFLALLSSVWTSSPLFNAFLGFLPLVVTIVLLLFASENDLKQGVYWAVPFASALFFLAVYGLLNPLMNYQLNIGGIAVINLILGLLVVVGLILLEGREIVTSKKDEEFTVEKVGEYLASIEDKCKALNFVIGRVYRSSNGGTAKMREKLRINKDWYNDFNMIKPEELGEKKQEALTALHKIHDRLMLQAKKEKEVFSKAELSGIKHIARNKDGEDAIIDVLVLNDRDPVQQYYIGAVEGVRLLLAELDKI